MNHQTIFPLNSGSLSIRHRMTSVSLWSIADSPIGQRLATKLDRSINTHKEYIFVMKMVLALTVSYFGSLWPPYGI